MNRSLKDRIFIIVTLLTIGVLLTACSMDSETTFERIKKEGVVRVGFANDIPYGYKTPDGKLTGEAPEIARKVLSKMGIYKIEGVFTEFGSLIPALKAGRFDMIAAGMFILPERCREIAFSEPTYSIGQAFLIKAGNPKRLHSYEDVAKNPDTVICVMQGAAEGGYARSIGIPDARIFEVPDTPSGLDAVRSGRADVLALTSLSIQKLIDSANDSAIGRARPFKDPVIDGKTIRGYGAFGFRKEDRDFTAEFNHQLKAFIGTKEHLETVKSFGFAELPGKITAADLCQGR